MTLSKTEYNFFEQILKLPEYSLQKAVITLLKKAGYKNIVYTKDYVYSKGDIPIALVSHLDTVFSFPPEEIYYDREKNVMLSFDGLGTDDRAGVFSIFKIIKSGYKPHVIFTTGEEIGGIGAKAIAKIKCPFKDLKYIIELDRNGKDDCVFYDCDNKKFIKYIESFGFYHNIGTYSDIRDICRAWKIAGVNLSIGYKNEHTYYEILNVGDMFETIEKVKAMLDRANELNKPFKFIQSKDNKYNFKKCSCCEKHYLDTELFEIINRDRSKYLLCNNCLDVKIGFCEICGDAYVKQEEDEGFCENCSKKLQGDML